MVVMVIKIVLVCILCLRTLHGNHPLLQSLVLALHEGCEQQERATLIVNALST